MKKWKGFVIGILSLAIAFVGVKIWFASGRADRFIARDLKCNSFAPLGTIVDCDYHNTSGPITMEVVRLTNLHKVGQTIYLDFEKNDAKKMVIHEEIKIGDESDPKPTLAIFYVNFKLPPKTNYKLKGNPKTTKEFVISFTSDNMAGREATLLIGNQTGTPHLGSVYLYQP